MPTLLHRLGRWSDTTPDASAQRYHAAPGPDAKAGEGAGGWQTLTALDFRNHVHWLALALSARGIGAGDTLAIFAPNSPEWTAADLAIQLLGGRSAGIYPNATAREAQYILNHSSARAVVVADAAGFATLVPDPAGAGPELIVSLDREATFHPRAITFRGLLEIGRKLARRPDGTGARTWTDLLAKLDPHAPSMIVYTSGTTGTPKGALLSQDNLVAASDAAIRHWRLPYDYGSLFSFLPLCHVAERLQCLGVGITQHYVVTFATRFDRAAAELVLAQPTLLLSVPRLWEKMMEGVQAKLRASRGMPRELMDWALAVGARVAEARYANRLPNPLDLVKLKSADLLVLGRIRRELGLGRLEYAASGAAALAPQVAVWFRSIGVDIMEDFGQTESTGVICMTDRGVEAGGTVGRPVPGVQVRLAPDGELLCAGRVVFHGYLNDPAATAEALRDGWLHTGDLAELDERGRLRIRGRKKEVLKTSGGKMVAPAPIEEAIRAAPGVSQVCVVGDGRKFLAALITLPETRLAELHARELAEPTVTRAEIIDPLKAHLEEVNAGLASYERVKRFAVLTRPFTAADGELTPTLKMKRTVIEQRFRAVIDGFYADARSGARGKA